MPVPHQTLAPQATTAPNQAAEPPAPTAPVVSIVIVTYNALSEVRTAIEHVQTRTHVPFELIVVDNASDPETRAYLASVPGIVLIQNEENRLWCGGCNQGIRAAHRKSHILLLNSDIEILRDDWLEVLLNVMESDPKVGMVGTQLHLKVPLAPVFGWLDGHCMLIRRETLNEVGLLDEVRWPWGGAPMEFTAGAYARGWIYKVLHPSEKILLHLGERSKTTTMRERFKKLPKPRPAFADTLRRYDIEPSMLPVDRFKLLKPLQLLAHRRRFYYAPPVPAPARWPIPAREK